MRYITRKAEGPTPVDWYCEAILRNQEHFTLVPAHTHNFYEIYIFLSGPIKIAIEDKVYPVEYGDILLIPPYTIHQLVPVDSDTDFEYRHIYMYFTEPCLASFDFNGESLLTPILEAVKDRRYSFHIPEDDFNRIYQAVFMIFRSKETDYYGKQMLNQSRIIEAITLLNKHILLDNTPHKTTHISPVIDDVSAYINQHYQEPITLDSLARQFFIDKSTLSRMFKKQLMVTVHKYITMKRISTAKLLIKAGGLPTKVYMDVGFSDYSTFYRAFKKSENISPEKFRMLMIAEKIPFN